MNRLKITGFMVARWVWLGVLASVLPFWSVRAAEEKFDVLQIGSQTYQNVTVTTKSKNYIFLMHSGGLANIKVADLPPDILAKLYPERVAKPEPKPATAQITAFAKQSLTKLETPQVKGMEEQLLKTWEEQSAVAQAHLPPITPQFLLIVAASAAALYLFYCYCCMLICAKAGQKSGLLVWLPGLKLLPMLKAAGMSRWWFLAYFVPVLNLVAHILWCFKISDARGKNQVIAVALILPVTNILAFLYLAFSDASPPPAPASEKRERPVELMTLETA
jgi:hypothetical protein